MINLFQRSFCESLARYSLPAIVLAALVATSQTNVLAQQETGQNTKSDESAEPAELQTFQLRYIDGEMVSDVLQTLLAGEPGVRLAVGIDNRVIVLGPPATLQQVQKTLEMLDQPPQDPSVTKVFSLSHSEASMAADLIGEVFDDVRVAFDARTNSLVVSAPSEDTLDKVEALAAHLDERSQPSQSNGTYKIDMFWLIEAGDDGEGGSDKTTAPDPRIAQVINELKLHGFAGASQVGHVSVVAKSGGEFSIRSNESLGQLDMQGKLEEISDRQLELMLELEIVDQETDLFSSVRTEINTQPDHNVVIGIAGATDPNRRSAFVIRVEK